MAVASRHMSASAAQASRNLSLDGLRGLAIALVVLYHLNLVGFGWVGVQLFFVLSGFLITRLLLALRSEPSLGRYLKTFYGRRALRIFPVYYLYLLLLLLFWWLLPGPQQGPVSQQWGYAASYTSNWLGMTGAHQKTYFLDHFWSLAIEEQFYLFWPLLLFFVPPRRLPGLLLALTLAGPLLRWGVSVFWPAFSNTTALPHAIALCTLSQLDAFAIGGLLCFAGPALQRLRHPGIYLASALTMAWLAGAWVNGAGLLPMQHYGAYLTLGYPNTLPASSQWLWGYSVINALSALLIGLVVHAGFSRKLFEQAWLVQLGRISYGVYILHFPLAHLSSPAIHRIQDWTGANLYLSLLLYTPLYLCLLLGLATLLHDGFEQRWLGWKERWFPLPQRPQ